ncbi:phosphatidylinositol-4-phosphate 5-Kinase domain-containing protein [Ditylenchus destructor]|nr:phosphatidylinositol-4-phosphate 5-Kinase domain-containing protein [Ditylenchus destructor]
MTSDHKYVLKTISDNEGKTLLKMMQAYTEHLIKNPNSLLITYMGYFIYQKSNGSVFRMIVMLNLAPRRPALKFDIKGIKSRAYTENEDTNKPVPNDTIDPKLIINTFVHIRGATGRNGAPTSKQIPDSEQNKKNPTYTEIRLMKEFPQGIDFLYEHPRTGAQLINAEVRQILAADAEFLFQQRIVDYSLLMFMTKKELEISRNFFSAQKRDPALQVVFQIRLGIIDTLIHEDFIKVVESLGKRALGFFGFGKKPEDVTIQPPEKYKDRFVKFIITDGHVIALDVTG